MSRHSHKEFERIKRIGAKMTVGTGEAKAHSLHRLVRGERQNPLYMNTKCNCCGTPLVRAVEIGLCAHCCDGKPANSVISNQVAQKTNDG